MNKDTHETVLKDMSKSDLNVIKVILSVGRINFHNDPPIVAEIKKIEYKVMERMEKTLEVRVLQSKVPVTKGYTQRKLKPTTGNFGVGGGEDDARAERDGAVRAEPAGAEAAVATVDDVEDGVVADDEGERAGTLDAGGVDLIGRHRGGNGAELGAEGVHRGRAAREVEGVTDDGRAIVAVGGRGRRRGVEHLVRGDGLEVIPRVGSGIEQPIASGACAITDLIDDGMEAGRERGAHRGGTVDDRAAETIARDGYAVDEEGHAVVRSGPE